MNKVSQFSKGLSKNFSPVAQPEESITFTLNGIRSSHKGDIFHYQSEPGNELCLTLKEDYKVIGSGYGTDNELFVFSTDEDSSEIGLLKNCQYTELVNANFGFSKLHPILVTFRIKNGCERIIYWVDGNNEDRFFNVDRPELFQDELGNWDLNKFKLTPDVITPQINIVSVNDSGGFLPLGGYYAQIEILDEGLNVVYKSYISPETIIYDDSTTLAYNQIDGGLNIDKFVPEFGGQPVTNKSISYQFTNIDTSFKYIRVNIIRAITGDGFTVDAHSVGQLIPIGSDTINFTYQGYNPNAGDTPIDYSSLLIPVFSYNSSQVITQVQNRLVRANVKLKERDYTGYQRIVNEILTACVVKSIDKKDILDSGNPKNSTVLWENVSHMEDEVYAKGIVFAYNDGTVSPAFHVPGRQKTSVDDQLLTVVDIGLVTDSATEVDYRDTAHLGLMVGDTVERWKVFNTGNIISGNQYHMAYYETEEVYPDTVDCTGVAVYGDLAGTPIRHHRFPDRKIIELDDENDFTILGLKFFNVQFPDDDIIGYYIVNVKRDDFNKTVLDSGVLYPARDVEDGFIGNRRWFNGIGLINKSYATGRNSYSSVAQPDSKNWIFFSPRTQFNQDYLNGSYFKFINNTNFDYLGEQITSYPDDYDVTSQSLSEKNYTTVDINNREYVGSIYVNSYSIQPTSTLFTEPVVNTSHSNNYNFYKTTHDIEVPSEDTWYFYYVLNKKVNNNCYSSLENLIYYHGSPIQEETTSDDLYIGDTYVSNLGYYDLVRYPVDLRDAEVNYASDLWFESEINSALRHSGTDECSKYFIPENNDFDNINDYAYSQITTLVSGAFEQRTTPCKEFYGYNKDYSRLNFDYTYVPIPQTYNYCGQCKNYRTTRIIYSPQSFDEELTDTYRVTLSEDYKDVSANKGQILGLKYKRNQLVVNCEEGSFILQPNPQQIATDQNLAYITTGDFLAIPPQEIVQSDIGYGGLQDKLATINTKYGYVWADVLNGQLHEFGDGIKSLSGELEYWFIDNMGFAINETIYNAYSEKLAFKSTIAGVGMQLSYDPLYDRLLVHKSDYDLTKDAKLLFTGVVESDDDFTFGLQVNINNGKWKVTGFGSSYFVDITNKDLFINKSWTLSYSYETQSWVSWHSYQPQFMMYDTHSFYSCVDNECWKHLHDGNYQTFYDRKYDFIIEYVSNNPATQDLRNVHYYGQTLSLDSDSDQWIENRDVTFNRMLVYNQYQSTGIQDLNLILQDKNPYGNLTYSATAKNVTRTDKNYKIGQIWDMSVQQPVVSSDWNLIQSEYEDGQGYIDIVSNDDNIDYTRAQRNLRPLKDKWFKTRLYFKPEETVKKLIYFTNTSTNNSIR